MVSVRHEFNCDWQHRLVVDGAAGLPASYAEPAWVEVAGRRYMACTEFCGDEAVNDLGKRVVYEITRVTPKFSGPIRTYEQHVRDCTERCVCFQS